MEVASFAEIADAFRERYTRIVWCTVATMDTRGRPRTRILHPIWEGSTGYILTNRHSLKEKHLAGNPYVSLSYWDSSYEQAYVDARTEWEDDQSERARIWELYKATPGPLGFDPAIIWTGPDDPVLGVLKLTPWRIELSNNMPNSKVVWRPA